MKTGAKRNYTFYVLMLLIFGGLFWMVIREGKLWDRAFDKTHREAVEMVSGHVAVQQAPASCPAPLELFTQSLHEGVHHPVAMLLLQIISILVAVRIFSWLFKYLGQPGVIGEIVAGIVLGPSLLGHFFPETFGFLFAPDSLESLNILSQIGLILFMFIIGMELDLGILRKKGSQTLVISHASIIVPFFLGTVLAWQVYPEFGFGHTTFVPFALFIGISVSITAFPVLARIIQERNLGKTPMGMLAIASAANNDITAWCLLAAIIAIAKAGSVASAGYTLLCVILYVLFMFGLVRPFMRKLGNIYNSQEIISKPLVAFIFLVLILSSYITEVLGVHALFGAFVAGVIMPANLSFRRIMTEKVEDVALVLFLPLFFVFTGLRTEIGALNTAHLWVVCALFVAVSIVGKLAGAALSARFVGESWKDSLSIGVLMNTRGLMELIVLNIGYEMGVLPSSIYVIFVIMALFTTFMATPSLVLIDKLFARRRPERRHSAKARILISFARPSSAPVFLKLVKVLCGRLIDKLHITAVHYTIGTETSPMNAYGYSSESFVPLRDEARELGMQIETRYRVTDHYLKDLIELIRRESYDFVLLGGGPEFINDYVAPRRSSLLLADELNRIRRQIRKKMYFPGESTRDKARRLFANVSCSVGVFVNRNFRGADRIGVLMLDERDRAMLDEIDAILGGVKVTLRVADAGFAAQLQREVRHLDGGPALAISPPSVPFSEFIAGQQMLIVSYNSWLHITRSRSALIPSFPSFMVVKPARAQVPGQKPDDYPDRAAGQADAVTFDGSVQSVSADPGIRAAAEVTATGSAVGVSRPQGSSGGTGKQ